MTVVSLSLTGQPLTPVNAFILLSLINLLRENFCVNLAYGFLQSYDAYVSLNRIQDFLLLDNVTSTSSTRKNKEESEKVPVTRKVTKLEQDHILLVENAMQQEKDRDEGFILRNVEFTTKKGSLVALSGPVGSGKSTLLATIAGEGTSKKLPYPAEELLFMCHRLLGYSLERSEKTFCLESPTRNPSTLE